MSDAEETVPKSVMLERLERQKSAYIKQIEELEGKAATLQQRLDEAPDATQLTRRYERLEKRYEELTASIEQERAGWTKERSEWETTSALIAAGVVDPDDQDLVRYRWGRLAEEERPPLAEYLTGPAKEDRILSGLFGAKEPPAPPVNGAAARNRTAPPPTLNDGGNLAELAKLPPTHPDRLAALGFKPIKG